jgi:hypothetical protein
MITTEIFSIMGHVFSRDASHMKFRFKTDMIFNVYRLYINDERTSITIPLDLKTGIPNDTTNDMFLTMFFKLLNEEFQPKKLTP